MNSKLIIYGYNNKNLGDDLMFASIINNTQYDEYYFYGQQIQPEFVDKKVKFIKYGRALPIRWKFKADFAVIGGSVLMATEDKHYKMLKQKQRFFRLNKLYGGNNYIIGANLGPYRDKSEYLNTTKKLNSLVDQWLVRDAYSADLLADAKSEKCHLMPDIVMGFPVDKYRDVVSKKELSISVTQVSKDGKGAISPELYELELVAWIEQYIDKGYHINMLSFEDSIDLPIIESITSKLSEKRKKRVNTIAYVGDDVFKAIAQSETVISTRFHCMVISALLKKNQIIYSYSKKTENFANDYGFDVHAVTGEIKNKLACYTEFPADAINKAKSYPQVMRQVHGN